MATIEKSIDVDVPVTTAYNQWTQFETFPEFMEGVERVAQLDDTTLEWTVKIGMSTREFNADITEQRPDQRIAWTAQGETRQAGVVTFHQLDDDRTRVMLQMDLEPTDWVERAADAANVIDRRVEGDLERFKELIESRGSETGAWRGEVE